MNDDYDDDDDGMITILVLLLLLFLLLLLLCLNWLLMMIMLLLLLLNNESTMIHDCDGNHEDDQSYNRKYDGHLNILTPETNKNPANIFRIVASSMFGAKHRVAKIMPPAQNTAITPAARRFTFPAFNCQNEV
jgi:hypothetical protein